MSNRPYSVLVIALVLCMQAWSGSASSADTSDRVTEQDILNTAKALDDALMQRSAAAYISHLADNFVYSAERPGLFGKSTVNITRSEFETSLTKNLPAANYLSISHQDRVIVISHDGRGASVTEKQIEIFARGAKDIISISVATYKYELRNGTIVLTSLSQSDIEQQEVEPSFSDADFAAYAGDGTATLEGEAFLRMQSGNIKNCAGAHVLLAPATRYDLAVMGAFLFSRLDTALKRAGPAAKYWRETQCDQQGKFSFENLPVGEWVVLTEATFEVVDQNLVLGNLTSGRGLAGGVVSVVT